ncbi:HNH endonuclease [Vibrio sp. 10N.222.49.A3]|uniref:HNH endonuclease n=1 Tax=Vibrio sp. 10N.222.49.A3 TaxID=3229611 RepID=UPI001C9793D6
MFGSLMKKTFGSDYRANYFERNPSVNGWYKCNGCNEKLRKGDSNLTIDHIVPQKFGGSNSVANLQVLCRSCNSKKNAKINALTLKYSGEALIREVKNIRL